MIQTKKVLALLLCIIIATTVFCAVPLSASAEENNSVDSQMVVAEVPTEVETENASEGTIVEFIDTVNENTDEVSSESVVNIDDYSSVQRTLYNQSFAATNVVERATNVVVVEFSKAPITLGVGETYTFSKADLQRELSATTTTTYTWSSNNSNIVSVDKNGKITAKTVGETTINVLASNKNKAVCRVVVENAPTKISLNKVGATLGVGETLKLSASLPIGTASYSINFSSNNTSVATVDSSSGLITAKKAGTAVITATTYNGKTVTCTVTVKNAPDKITLNKTTITLGVGENFALKASLPSGTASYSVRVSSSNSSVAVFNTACGLLTAKNVGTAVITFTTYNGKTATCTVTVKNAPTSVTLNKTSLTLGVGETFDFNASLPSGTTAYSVKYSSNNTSVATIDSYGITTAKKAGTAIITVKTYNGKTATCTLTVKNAPTKITLNKTSLTLGVGETFDLNASLPSGTASYSVEYSSNNTAVATVDSYGITTAKKAGTAVITVTTYNGKKATCTVTVQKDITEEYVNEVLRLTNEERKKAGLPALAKRTDLDKVAATRAKEISVKFSHTRPNGKNCFSILSENGISYATSAENIAGGQESPEEVVDAWMNSDGHRKNILNSKYKGLGVGCYIEDDTIYWVQMMVG